MYHMYVKFLWLWALSCKPLTTVDQQLNMSSFVSHSNLSNSYLFFLIESMIQTDWLLELHKYLFHTALLTYHMYLLWVLQVLLRNLLYESGTVALGNSQVSLPHIFLDFSHVSTLSFTIPPYKITVRFWHYSSRNFAGTSSTHHCWHLTCKNSQFHNSFLESYCMIMTQ